MIILITPCSASKDDSATIPGGSRVVGPQYYLDRTDLIDRFYRTRENIFQDKRTLLGNRITHAFDLYVSSGRVYQALRKSGNRERMKAMLLSSDQIEWFFLSGAYGIIHALEPAKRYQATFSKSIAYQKGIPCTTTMWSGLLSSVCEAIVLKFQPKWVYVFGSQDYTNFIKRADFWTTRNNLRMLESTGSSGPYWLSPSLNELVEAILDESLDRFNTNYPRFAKQQR